MPFEIGLDQMRIVVALVLVIFGVLFEFSGLWKLLSRDFLQSARVLATHSARLSQKGLTEDISRLVESTSRLSDSVNAMLRTSYGVGGFLILAGIVFFVGAYLIVR